MVRNEELLKARTEMKAGFDEPLRRVVFDSETSGGLLVVVASAASERLLKAMHVRGVSEALEVGHVEARGGHVLKFV